MKAAQKCRQIICLLNGPGGGGETKNLGPCRYKKAKCEFSIKNIKTNRERKKRQKKRERHREKNGDRPVAKCPILYKMMAFLGVLRSDRGILR